MCEEENPWNVVNLEQFLYYCCPECNEKDRTKDSFLEHAVTHHSKIKEFLQNFQSKNEPINIEENKSNESHGKGNLSNNIEIITDIDFQESLNHEIEVKEEYSEADDKLAECIILVENLKENSIKLPVHEGNNDSIECETNNPSEKDTICNLCNIPFSDLKYLKRHYKEIHNEIPKDIQYKQPKCDSITHKNKEDHKDTRVQLTRPHRNIKVPTKYANYDFFKEDINQDLTKVELERNSHYLD